MNRVCKAVQMEACTATESPLFRKAKSEAFKLCAQARARREDTCFKGGDAGHRKQISMLWSGYNRCVSLGIEAPVQ